MQLTAVGLIESGVAQRGNARIRNKERNTLEIVKYTERGQIKEEEGKSWTQEIQGTSWIQES